MQINICKDEDTLRFKFLIIWGLTNTPATSRKNFVKAIKQLNGNENSHNNRENKF